MALNKIINRYRWLKLFAHALSWILAFLNRFSVYVWTGKRFKNALVWTWLFFKWRKKVSFSNENGYVWTRPKALLSPSIRYASQWKSHFKGDFVWYGVPSHFLSPSLHFLQLHAMFSWNPQIPFSHLCTSLQWYWESAPMHLAYSNGSIHSSKKSG